MRRYRKRGNDSLLDSQVPETAFQKVPLLIASANRDESRWERPDRLDITRRVARHVAFGTGIHGCVGQMIAPA